MTGVLIRRGVWTHTHAQGDDRMKTQGEEDHLQAEERGLRMRLTLLTTRSYAFSLQNYGKNNFCLSLYYGSPSKLINMQTQANR